MTPSARIQGIEVTRQQVLDALIGFDEDYRDTNGYRSWLDHDNYKYALVENHRLYPPKYILSRATGIPLAEMNGGDGSGSANTVLSKLEFEVIPKEEVLRLHPANK